MKVSITGLMIALLFTSCSVNPPKPPHCDGSDKRPINVTRTTNANDKVIDTCSRG